MSEYLFIYSSQMLTAYAVIILSTINLLDYLKGIAKEEQIYQFAYCLFIFFITASPSEVCEQKHIFTFTATG